MRHLLMFTLGLLMVVCLVSAVAQEDVEDPGTEPPVADEEVTPPAPDEDTTPLTPEEEVREAADKLLEAAVTGDEEVIGEYLHEAFVLAAPIAVAGWETLRGMMGMMPEDAGIDLDDFEIEIIGDIAVIYGPLAVPEIPMIGDADPKLLLNLLFLSTDEGWRALCAGIVVTEITIDENSPPQLVMGEQMSAEAYKAFRRAFRDARKRKTPSSLLELFHPAGFIAATLDADGSMSVVPMSDAEAAVEQLGVYGTYTAVDAREENLIEIEGLASAIWSRTVVVSDGTDQALRREFVIAAFVFEELQWQAAALIDIPVE